LLVSEGGGVARGRRDNDLMDASERIPYERYFEVSMTPEPGQPLHSYEYLRRLTSGVLDEYPTIDAHTHLGRDVDGRSLSLPDLLAELDRFHVDRAVVFPFNDPEQGDDFRVPNERVWAAYEQAPERIVPFMRLNPNGPWEQEYERCRDRGHRGIKLHPRAQHFAIGSSRARELFARAAADQLPVIVHTGFGVEDVADAIGELLAGPNGLTLLLAHSSFIEMNQALRVLGPRSNVYFETSVVPAYDLIEVLTTVDPSRVIFGSDLPYADCYTGIQSLAVMASFAGIGVDRLPDLLGGNLLRILNRRPRTEGSG